MMAELCKMTSPEALIEICAIAVLPSSASWTERKLG